MNRLLVLMRATELVQKCHFPIKFMFRRKLNLLVNAGVDPNYGSFLAIIRNKINSWLNCREITTSVSIDAEGWGCVSVWRRKVRRKIFTNVGYFSITRVFIVVVVVVVVVTMSFFNAICNESGKNWWWKCGQTSSMRRCQRERCGLIIAAAKRATKIAKEMFFRLILLLRYLVVRAIGW